MSANLLPRYFRRQLHRLWRWIRRPALHLVYDRRYELSVSGLPLDPLRADRILTFLSLERLIGRTDLRRPRPVSLQVLRAVHTDPYLDSLQQPEALGSILGIEVTESEAERILLLQRRMVGGTLEATRLALQSRGVAANLGGGFHHARADQGGGFCVFNDVAAAVAHLRSEGFEAPILVIDCDLHDGEGTRRIFAEDPSVHTYSIHNRTLDDAPAVEATVLELGPDVRDEAYLSAVRQSLPPVFEAVRPGLVYYLAGADPAEDDEIGDWRITADGLLERDRLVSALVRERARPAPLVILLSGGYGPNAWRYPARFFGRLLSGRVVEPPPHEEMVLARYRQLARLLDPAQLSGLVPDAEGNPWSLSEQDIYGSLDFHARPDRLLGFYTLHGIELALERYGLLSQLRALGFKEPTVSMDLDDPSGHRVRVHSGPDRAELLIELLLRRDSRTIPGMELLVAEWLLLQNPRAAFTPDRPRLPGQTRPGLGLLPEIVALLVLICDRLKLDGLLYTPSHYHTATFSTGRGLHFLRPRDEAEYRSVRKAAAGLSLAEASWALDQGRLLGPDGQPLRWKSEPMVLPVSDRLKRWLEEVHGESASDPSGREERERTPT
jgi:acetoin utilization deacetylase AcuC-like enzyme